MVKKTYTVQRTARVYFNSTFDSSIKAIWLLFHGYGQLAVDFLGECGDLAEDHSLLIAPEGLSRFYTRGGSGKVGASWMTREERDDEILEYLTYINTVLDDVFDVVGSSTMLNILGFSQGGATAMRYALRGDYRCQNLILWGSGFPTSELALFDQFLEVTRVIAIKGRSDNRVSGVEWESMVSYLSNRKIDFSVTLFDGGHHLDQGILKQLRIKGNT